MNETKPQFDPRQVIAQLYPDWKERFQQHFDMVRELMRQQKIEPQIAARRIAGIATGIDAETAMIILACGMELAKPSFDEVKK